MVLASSATAADPAKATPRPLAFCSINWKPEAPAYPDKDTAISAGIVRTTKNPLLSISESPPRKIVDGGHAPNKLLHAPFVGLYMRSPANVSDAYHARCFFATQGASLCATREDGPLGACGLISLLSTRLLVEDRTMTRTIISTPLAPAAIGTYSQAVRVGDTVYLSGQIGLDPATMKMADGIDAQIVRVFDNLRAVAEAAGGSLADVVKLNVYLTDLIHFTTVNEVMGCYFAEPFPARAAVGVASLPRGALVEADAVMVVGG
ncbi:MAG: Enamine/imine deaminase [Candidatus Accumulibacter sp. SK-11]|nr:MAG: Enamine/imine deaminase [Candidatus Accumulibacter sp. SK-11]